MGRINKFEKLWEEALENLETGLPGPNFPKEDVQEIVDLLQEIDFPSSLAILANRGQADGGKLLGKNLLRDIADRSAEESALRDIGADSVEDILSQLFVRRIKPEEVSARENAFPAILVQAANRLSDQGVAIRPEEARTALRLLATGKFFTDIGEATAAVIYTIPTLPVALVNDVHSISPLKRPRRVAQLTLAVGRDVIGLPVRTSGVVADLLDGTLDHPPTVMKHTLEWLYGVATVRVTVDTINTLLENETVRLAIVLYARANGIPLEPGHLDVLRNSVLKPSSPDLGPPLSAGIQNLRGQYGQGQVEKLLRSLAISG